MKGRYYQVLKNFSAKSFKDAFKKEFGYDWDWKGGENHPTLSDDPRIVYFYKGYRSIKAKSDNLKKIADEVEKIEKRLKDLNKIIEDI